VIVGTGVDLAEVDRIARPSNATDRALSSAVHAPRNRYVERKANRFERYAARFAARKPG